MQIYPFPHEVLVASRWLTWLFVILYAFNKKSLTTWILVSMIIGVEIGLNFPAFCSKPSSAKQDFLTAYKNYHRTYSFCHSSRWYCWPF